MRACLRRLSAVMLAGLAASCLTSPAALTQLMTGRRLAAEMDVALGRTNDAANRAVMARDDADASAAAGEARQAFAAIDDSVTTLRAMLVDLGYRDDVAILNRFAECVAGSRTLTEEVLALTLDGSNLKAQRLSFGPAADASDALRAALDEAIREWSGTEAAGAREQALRVYAAVLEIRALHGRHIAEPGDDEMTALEGTMAGSAEDAKAAFTALKRMSPPKVAASLDAGGEALDRFLTVNDEIVALSRRNSNVRAFALTLGTRRTVTADCSARLEELEQALARHEFTATR